MASVVNSFSLAGIDAYTVKIETDTIYGKPSINIVGLGDTTVKESKERLEAAIKNAKYELPKMKIVINLSPSDIKKSGSHFDLGMAIGILIRSKQITVNEIEKIGFIGELSLNADLRACSGILPMVIAAKNSGINNIVVAKENMEEASLVKDVNIFAFETLQEVIEFIERVNPYKPVISGKANQKIKRTNLLDFEDVKGQEGIIEFILVAAAGGHNMLMTGTPGCGKSMIAKRIPTILPGMNEQEALEVTKIYSVSGLLKSKGNLITERPFRAPHHNASMNSIIGGGNNAMPGEISLAHNGVLFLDEIAEFNKQALDSLRQPLEDGNVTISRVKYTNTYPSNFMLIAAMNPCPCGYRGTSRCRCTDYEVLRYREKISGPILDRIDIQKYVQPVNFIDISNSKSSSTSKELREKVENARKIQQKRFEKIENINRNAQMTTSHIKEFCSLDKESIEFLKKAFDRFNFSARSYHKFLKLSRTFADMDNSKDIKKTHVAKALMCRDLDKEQSKMIAMI
ncbi:YifB family Mg chelatase-like AAA ATPase [Clostridium estertheticum]|uniref:YifB family Mg chelatase-like AAA ATPase n=1 Tax=Clostridium estertheticum TaxID=238834 RepID=UPI0013E94D0B|nr:YifB family Mg chelatase-like AAA ATPase [Clostridium estertheticum]MBZ9688911.1 YifB family Mg chelatase-like AAA ATPase [Clostridium estertheticum]